MKRLHVHVFWIWFFSDWKSHQKWLSTFYYFLPFSFSWLQCKGVFLTFLKSVIIDCTYCFVILGPRDSPLWLVALVWANPLGNGVGTPYSALWWETSSHPRLQDQTLPFHLKILEAPLDLVSKESAEIGRRCFSYLDSVPGTGNDLQMSGLFKSTLA